MSDGRPYVHGNQYTVSDPYLLVFSRWLDRADLGPVDKCERVAAHRKRIEDRPAVKKVLAAEA
jgi:glutathione S-transferase